MSFGFSVGDFIVAIELANKIRREFVDASSQFKAILDVYVAQIELRSLLIKEMVKDLLQNYLVNRCLLHNEKDTKVLLEQLTYLPLAIVQAAAYINENGITVGDYLSHLSEQEEVVNLLSEEFEDGGRYHDVKNPVATADLIRADSPAQSPSSRVLIP
jgi:hypothetical protein